MFSRPRRTSQSDVRPKRKPRGFPSDLEIARGAQPDSGLADNALMSLQRSYGNQFVQRLMTPQKNDIQRTPEGQGQPGFVGPLTADESKKKQALVERIEKNYGIKLDDEAGIKAANKSYFFEDRGKSNPFKLKKQGWSVAELEALEDMLKQYAPIMGASRAGSTLSGIAQGLKTISRVDTGLNYDKKSYIGSSYIDRFFIEKGVTEAQLDAIVKMTDDQAKAAGIDLKERDFLKDILPDWKERNEDEKSGKVISRDGHLTDTYTQKHAGTAGEHFGDSGNISLYNTFTKHEGPLKDLSKSMRVTIAHELAHALIGPIHLKKFVATFADYWIDESTRVTGEDKVADKKVEAPLTWYGGTNAGEDLAETAGYFFAAPSALDKGLKDENFLNKPGVPGNSVPRRKAFMERVVAEWTSAPIKSFGVKSDAVLALKDSQTQPQIESVYKDADDAYKALPKPEQKKVKAQYDAMTAHYKRLLKSVQGKTDANKKPAPSK